MAPIRPAWWNPHKSFMPCPRHGALDLATDGTCNPHPHRGLTCCRPLAEPQGTAKRRRYSASQKPIVSHGLASYPRRGFAGRVPLSGWEAVPVIPQSSSGIGFLAECLVEHRAAASLTATFFSLATATPVPAITIAAQNTAILIGIPHRLRIPRCRNDVTSVLY